MILSVDYKLIQQKVLFLTKIVHFSHKSIKIVANIGFNHQINSEVANPNDSFCVQALKELLCLC